LTKRSLADPEYLNNKETRLHYSKLRSAIGGVYLHRRLTDEAEYALRQALTLYPSNPEASGRLGGLYVGKNRFDDAIAMMKSLQQLDPTNQKFQTAITQLQTMKQAASRSTEKSP